MKKVILFIGMILLFGSCNQLEDQNYDAGPEKFYPPRVINTQGYPGYKRAKITWEFSANNINTAKSIYITITAAAIGFEKVVTIDNLVDSYEENGLQADMFYKFTVQTKDREGNLSILNASGGQSAEVFVYGDFFLGLKNELPLVAAKGAGICVVDFKRDNATIFKADVLFNNIIKKGKSAYYIEVPVDGTTVNVAYSDYKFYRTAGEVLGLDAVKVPVSNSIAVSSTYLLIDKVVFADNVVKLIAGDITYDDWQNKTTSLTFSGVIQNFNDLYLCKSLATLTLDATGGTSTTSPNVAPINFLIEQGTLTKIIISDETVFNNIKSKITDQSIVSTE